MRQYETDINGPDIGVGRVPVQNEEQLAAVMGHEVAHATARHSAERMTQQMIMQYGLQAAGSTLEMAAQKL